MDRESSLLVWGLVISTAAMITDEVIDHPLFKAAKILALLASLGLAFYRIRSYKPYVALVKADQFHRVSDEGYEFEIPVSIHKRGPTPKATYLVKTDGGWSDAIFGTTIDPDGTLKVHAGTPMDVKVLVRR